MTRDIENHPETETMTITIDQITEAIESGEYIGFCTACGAEHYEVEPDACNYECEECGAKKVFGAEELLVMGYC